MSARSIFRGVFWGLVAIALFGHVLGGWVYSSRVINDAFEIDPDPFVVVRGDFDLTEVVYPGPLGDMVAWLLPSSSNTWVIHVHGKGVTPAEPEFLFGPLQDAGYTQLSITYRNDENQPRDPSGYYQYGETEWQDLAAAVAFAQENGAQNIIFSGFSTGSAHILSYAYRNDLDQIKGIIFDSPNIDLGDTVDFRGEMEDLPIVGLPVPPTFSWVARFATSLRIGVNWKSLDYIERGKGSLRVPVLVHHGIEDDSVPVRQSIAFAESQPEFVTLIQVPGAGHVGSYETDPDAYLEEILDFLDQVDQF